MSGLAEFLRARLDEDRAWADNPECAEDPARVLREVEAKRRMLEEIADLGHCPGCTGDPTLVGTAHECPTDGARMRMLPLLALPYADHPDYRQEWKP